jgi:hypothetical protein
VNEAGQRARHASGPIRMRATVTDAFGLPGSSTGGPADGTGQFLVDG